MISVSFYLKSPNDPRDTPIVAQVCYSGQKFKYHISEKINPRYWSFDLQRAKRNKDFPEYMEFNARLEYIESIVKITFRKYLNDYQSPPTLEKFKQLLRIHLAGKREEKQSFWIFFEELIKKSIEGTRTHHKTGDRICSHTIKTYQTTYRHLKEFQEKTKKLITFENVDLDLYNDLIEYLTYKAKLAKNSIGKHVQIFKTVLNEAFELGLHSNPAYRSKRFMSVREDSDSIYLNDEELCSLYNLDLSCNPKLEKVRDLFLVGCYTGLRFSDYSNLTHENLNGDYLEIVTQKTNTPVVIPLHPRIKAVFNRYNGVLSYPISNQKLNEYIKEIAKLCPALSVHTSTSITKAGIVMTQRLEKWKLVSSHTARRSFATNLFLQGFPAINIMKITGHKTETAFMKYIKVTPKETAQLLALHWQKNTIKIA